MKGALAALFVRLRMAQAALERALLGTFLALALRPTAGPGAPPPKPSSILVLRPDEIGDMVLAVPLLRTLRRRYPRARVSLLAQAKPGSLAMELGLADELICFKGSRPWSPVLQAAWRAWRCAVSLRGRRFDMVLYPRWGADYRQMGLLAALLPPAFKAAFSKETSPEKAGWDCLPEGVWGMQVTSRSAHEAGQLLDFMAALGLGAPRPGDRRLSDPALIRAAAERLARSGKGPWLAVAPFARSGRRLWPLDLWAPLILDLARARGLSPFVVAGPAEDASARHLGSLLGPGTPVFIAGLRESAALFSRARLFAGADSASHLAAAEGLPCLVLSCHPVGAPVWHANAPERFGPWGVESLVLRPTEHAWPCRRGCEAFTAHCILKLDGGQVRAAALAWRPGPPRPRP